MTFKTDAVGQVVARPAQRWGLDWGTEEGEDDVLEPTSLWEAEITALDDEQLLALEDSAEDG
jgi:hypothetical protein